MDRTFFNFRITDSDLAFKKLARWTWRSSAVKFCFARTKMIWRSIFLKEKFSNVLRQSLRKVQSFWRHHVEVSFNFFKQIFWDIFFHFSDSIFNFLDNFLNHLYLMYLGDLNSKLLLVFYSNGFLFRCSVPFWSGILMTDWYSNGGLNTKWWSEYQQLFVTEPMNQY